MPDAHEDCAQDANREHEKYPEKYVSIRYSEQLQMRRLPTQSLTIVRLRPSAFAL